jgi:hypothetical protein
LFVAHGFLAGGYGDLCVVPDRAATWLYLLFTSYHTDPQAQGIAVARGWRHADPESLWGPAVHFNRELGRYVMRLNHTANATGDLRQEGVYVSCSSALDDPRTWSPPFRLVTGGAWYPQIVGLQPGDGDTSAGPAARFFMAGFSMWELEFSATGASAGSRPLTVGREDFLAGFGGRRCPW